MKVGILTFPHSPSLGAMLQMGALYHTIEAFGHEVEIINYVSGNVNHQRKQPVTIKSIAIKMLSTLFLKSSKPSYEAFERKLKMYPQSPISSKEGMSSICCRFDRIIVGSDQVWNPGVTGHDLNFYLEFCEDSEKKASYAASFGYMQADKLYEDRIATLLNDFTYLGVREKQGQVIVKELTGRDAHVVLDPTLIVERQYLLNEMQTIHRKKKYALFFCIKPSAHLYDIAKEYATKNDLELVTIGGRMKDRFDPRKHPMYGVGPKEFLGLVNGAECVFTNSFHGTAISIALRREFFIEYSSDTNSRLINVIELLQLQDRVLGNQVPVESKIDYDTTDRILVEERRKSMGYLKSIFN